MISGKLRSRRFLAVSRILPSGAEAPVKKANRIRRSAPSGMTDERGDSRRRRNVRIPSGKFGSVPEEIPAWVLARKPRDKGSGGRTKSGRRERGTALFLLSGQKRADPSADLEWAAALRGKAAPVSPPGGLGTKRGCKKKEDSLSGNPDEKFAVNLPPHWNRPFFFRR